MPGMNPSAAKPRMLGSTVLILLLTAAALIPARAMAEPLNFNPTAASFPKTTVGSQSEGLEVQLYNPGEPATIDKIEIEGGDGSFSVQGSVCSYLQIGFPCAFWLSFAPSSAGLEEARVVVYFKEEGRPPEEIPVSGTAVPAQLGFAPEGHDFGLLRVDRESASAAFKLVNEGEAPIRLGNIGISGSGSNGFWTGDSDCWNRLLAPAETCDLQIWFGARELAEYEAELRVSVNNEVFSAPLRGQGGRAIVAPEENPVDFGAATAGSAGVVKTVTLANSGNLPTAFFIAVIAGGDAGSFELLAESCSAVELLPASTCTAQVRFQPRSAGPKSARLAFFGDGDDGTMVFLGGEGVAAEVSLLPSAHDFGGQAAATRSAARTFEVRNEGDAAIDLDSVAIVGADPDQFVLAGEECGEVTLAPGASCAVRVRFAPEGEGGAAATLRVRGSSGTLSSALSGTGTPASLASIGGEQGPQAQSAATVPEDRPQRVRHKRFGRGKGLHAGNGRAARRSELRAQAARR